MTKMRVHELARELGMDNRELTEILQKKNVEVKNHMSTIEDSVADEIRREASSKGENKAQSAEEKGAAKQAGQPETKDGAAPRKKNLAFVIRPQNSRNSSRIQGNRPAQRPARGDRQGGRPAQAGARPAHGARPAGERPARPAHAARPAAENRPAPEVKAPEARPVQTERPAQRPVQTARPAAEGKSAGERPARPERPTQAERSAQNGRPASEGRPSGDRPARADRSAHGGRQASVSPGGREIPAHAHSAAGTHARAVRREADAIREAGRDRALTEEIPAGMISARRLWSSRRARGIRRRTKNAIIRRRNTETRHSKEEARKAESRSR